MNEVHDEILNAYLDGELSPEERVRVEGALRGDEALRERLHRIEAADRALGALPSATADAEFTSRVVAAARREALAATRGRKLRFLWALPLAAAAALFASLFWPRDGAAPAGAPFSTDDYRDYVWEADAETYGALDPKTLQDEVLDELTRS